MQRHWVAEAASYSPSEEEEEEEDLFAVACEHLWHYQNFHGLDRAYPRGKDRLPEDGE